MEEIDRLKLRAQVVAQAAGLLATNAGEKSAQQIVEAAEVLWNWISKQG